MDRCKGYNPPVVCFISFKKYADDVQTYIHCHLVIHCSYTDYLTASVGTLLKLSLFSWIVVGDWRVSTGTWWPKHFPHLVFCYTFPDLGIKLDQELNFSAHINHLNP